MEFTRKQPTVSSKRISTISSLNEKYPVNLTMYLDLPNEQVALEEFQEMAIERAKLFKVLEMVSLKAVKGTVFRDMVIDEMAKKNLKYFMPLVKGYADAETRRKDYLSHFILRLAYCCSEELRKWFLNRELEFFRLKFSSMEKKDILLFIKKNNISFDVMTDEEKKSMGVDLYNSTLRNITLDSSNIYKIPFIQVLDLVRNRKVFVKKGIAYVPEMDLIPVLISIFKTKLTQGLNICAANITNLQGDERITRLLKSLHTEYMREDHSVKLGSKMSLNALEVSVKSFPLCMRAMHDTFKSTHHLKYYARLQYGLFLKGIGLSMEDSLKFWKEGFTKRPDIDEDVFEKRYAYSIRHSYGAEGKRANYTPHSCIKIINTSVGSGENHGCPFKHYDINTLKQKLLSYKLSMVDISGIIDYVTNGHYQLACTKYFEVTHNVTNSNGISHPNLFFEESQNIINQKENENSKNNEKLHEAKASKEFDEWEDDIEFDLNVTEIINNAKSEN